MTDPFEKFDLALQQCNQKLKAASVRVKVERKFHSLYLRATLPPKDDSDKTKPFQQHVPLNVKATPAGLKRAEAEAKKIAAAIDLKQFSWAEYPLRSKKAENQTAADWIAAFEMNYFERRKRTPTSESTFRYKYHYYFKRLPQRQPLTAAVLERAIKATIPDSCSRSTICQAYKALSQFAGIDLSFISKELKGAYSPNKPAPRILPEDEDIQRYFYTIANPKWQWIYGIIATFGVRPHEAFRSDTQGLEQGGCVLKVLEGTKTGYREVLPLHPEWIDAFGLRQKRLPKVKVDGRANKAIGKSVSTSFKRYKIPFPPYNLRHSYAVRCVRFRIPVSLAARWMGHSVSIHTRTYQAWLSKSVEQEAFEKAIQSPDRPQPPRPTHPEQDGKASDSLHDE